MSFLPAYKSCGDATMRGVLDGMEGSLAEAYRLSTQDRSHDRIAAMVATCLPLFHAAVVPYSNLARSLDRIAAAGVPMATSATLLAILSPLLKSSGYLNAWARWCCHEERVLKPEPRPPACFRASSPASAESFQVWNCRSEAARRQRSSADWRRIQPRLATTSSTLPDRWRDLAVEVRGLIGDRARRR